MCPGPPGSGKSFVVLDWLARVALGEPFQGKPVEKGRLRERRGPIWTR
jgi:AAA domain